VVKSAAASRGEQGLNLEFSIIPLALIIAKIIKLYFVTKNAKMPLQSLLEEVAVLSVG
jgi:hypothetical protein